MRRTSLVGTTLALALLAGACDTAQEDSAVSPLQAPSAKPTATTTPAPPPSITVTPTPPPTPIAPPAPTPTATPTPYEQLPGIFKDAVRTAPAAPIAGGTLLVTADGTTAVAADPDRNSVFLVDLATHAVRSVATEPGDQLGRVEEGPPGTVFVAARRGGAVLAVDLATASVSGRFPVCNAPRGLAYDAAQNRLYVACRSGRLVSLDATSGAVLSSAELSEDLRDVVLVNGSLVVTRFRSAEILRFDTTGTLQAVATPPDIGVTTPSVAFRGVPLSNGMMLLAHQVESSSPLGTGLGAYYGGGCAGGGVVQQVLSLVAFDGTPLPTAKDASTLITSAPAEPLAIASRIVVGAVGPLDLAVSRDLKRVAVVASGNSWEITGELPTLFVDALDVSSGGPPASFGGNSCNGAASIAHHAPGEPVAVAFDAGGRYVVQSREPAMLELEGDVFIPLSPESHFDTGFAMFHLNSSGGISCSSCHPEGGDDGHTWSFASVGLRRSQALEGNVGSRAPFHWSGDLATFNDLFNEVMLKRMALPVTPPVEAIAALTQ